MTVMQIQALLTYLGYDPGVVDGVTGPKTTAAVLTFQTQEGLTTDGKVGPLTEAALISAVSQGRLKKSVAVAPTTEQAQTKENGFQSKYFERREFRCPCGKCGGFPVEPSTEIVQEADALREAMGRPVIIVPPDGHSGGSGVRCAAYNATFSNSASNSRHIQGKAIDFSCPGASAGEIEGYLAKRKASGHLNYYYRISAGSFHMDVK